MSLNSYYLSIAEGKNPGFMAKALRTLLIPPSAVYSLFPLIKEKLYGQGLLKAGKLSVPVISVGNLSWGGTGKTPAVIEISKILKNTNIFHAVLSRGYGSRADSDESIIISDKDKVLIEPPDSSDENYLIAVNLPGVPVIQDKNRCRGGNTAVDKFAVGCLLLDDGFQHLKIARDINILLWDSRVDPENTFPIPAGTLRERISSAVRADIIILTKTNQKGSTESECESFFKNRFPDKMIFHSCHDISEIREYGKEESFKAESFAGKKAVAFCAIADDSSFKSTIEDAGIKITEFISFRDHHHYLQEDVTLLKESMKTSGADFLITTEKDISRNGRILKDAGPIIYPVIRFKVAEEEIFRKLILKPFN